MKFRTVGALLGTPFVAGLIAIVSFLVNQSNAQIGLREWVQIGAWVVFSVVFELVVLLPLARLSRSWKYPRFAVLCAGVATWSVLSFAWFVAVFNVSAAEAVLPTLRIGLAGILICGTFVVLSRRPTVPLPVPRGDTDA